MLKTVYGNDLFGLGVEGPLQSYSLAKFFELSNIKNEGGGGLNLTSCTLAAKVLFLLL